MRNKSLVLAVATALLGSSAAIAQERDPSQGTSPEGPSNGGVIEGVGLPGILCSEAGGTDCAIAIPDGLSLDPPDPGPPAVSTMGLQNCSGVVTDVNVGLDVSHTWVGDLIFTVTAPDATEVTIVDRPGAPASLFGCSGDDIFAVLDDGAGAPVEDECALAVPTIAGTLIPNNALSAFNGLDANGTWTLTATDNAVDFTGAINDWSLEVTTDGDACEGSGGEVEPQEPRATFGVQKVFLDSNPMPVQVTLSCNTGLPLTQTTTLNPDPSGNTYVEFVVRDFADGELDCNITESSVPAGYSPFYAWGEEGGVFDGEEGCFFENVAHGDVADTTLNEVDNFCIILNVPDVSTVTVTKEWIDENPQFNAQNFAEATWFCNNLPDFIGVGDIILPPLGQSPVLSSLVGGNSDSGNLVFLGNPGVDSFEIFGNWDGGTMCSVTEQIGETGVEADSSDCDNIVVFPGEDAECTIVNTRLYEGIPTLSQYGLGLLALLMLGMGFVAFRRMV